MAGPKSPLVVSPAETSAPVRPVTRRVRFPAGPGGDAPTPPHVRRAGRVTHRYGGIERRQMSDQVQSLTQDEDIEAQALTTEQLEVVDGGKVTMQDFHFTSTVNKSSP